MNPYWNTIKDDLPRFLAQFDNNPISKTYGSFDRIFWHQRRTDFSSSALQQGTLVLAQLYTFEKNDNPLYKKTETLNMILAALDFTCSIQHGDGSMDEWYPQERGWAGPTGYVLFGIIQTLKLLDVTTVPKVLLNKLKFFSIKAVNHLLKYEELDVLSNHQAMSLLAIYSAVDFFKIQINETLLNQSWDFFYKNCNEEGWSCEYDGCDPGYQTATLSFLSRLYIIYPSDKLKAFCLKQLDFLKNFIFPDGSFAGPMGSRGTGNVFHFGFEYWASRSLAAHYLADLTVSGLQNGTVLKPHDQEDHYHIYRLVEFLDCALVYKPKINAQPWSFVEKKIYFQNSGMLIFSNEDNFGILNLKKNAAGKVYNFNEKKFIFIDSGYFLQDFSNQNFTSSYIQNDRQISFQDDQVKLTGYFNKYSRPVFNQSSFFLFRFALLFIRHSKVAQLLKKWIRSKIMTGFVVSPSLVIERTLSFQFEFKVEDLIILKEIKIKKAFRSFFSSPRSVPQSLYSTQNQIGLDSFKSFTDNQIEELNTSKKLRLEVV